MPKFTITSNSRLKECHPELQLLFNTVIKTFDCSILVGHRTQADQEKAFKEGKSKLQWPNSKHNSSPSFAVDVAPYPIDWTNNNRFFWFAGYVLGTADQLRQQGKMKFYVRYGGDWNRDYNIDEKGLRDLVHFELVQI